MKVVFSGAGAAAISTAEHYVRLGVKRENILLCDRQGVVYAGRAGDDGSVQGAVRQRHERRTIADALVGADVFVGLSVAGAVTGEMVAKMAARSDHLRARESRCRRSLPTKSATVRTDAIIATGRSDYPNQVNNVLGFPFIFRGALDARATEVNEEMKMAATRALALLAQGGRAGERVAPVRAAHRSSSGPTTSFPSRSIRACCSGSRRPWRGRRSRAASRNEFIDLDEYREQLEARLGRARGSHARHHQPRRARSEASRVPRGRGAEDHPRRAASSSTKASRSRCCSATRKRSQRSRKRMRSPLDDIAIEDPGDVGRAASEYAHYLWERRQRKGLEQGEAQQLPLQRQLLRLV